MSFSARQCPFFSLCLLGLKASFFCSVKESRVLKHSTIIGEASYLLQFFSLWNQPLGSWTLHLRTLHLGMLYLRHFILGQLNLRAFTPSEISPSVCYTFRMFHLQDVIPFRCFTCRMFHLRAVTPSEVSPLNFSPSNVFRNCGRWKVC